MKSKSENPAALGLDRHLLSAHTKGSAMSLFFFHLVSKDEFIRDDKGKQFGDIFEAYCFASSLVHKALLYDVGDWRGWSIKITEPDGRSRLTVLFPQGPQSACHRYPHAASSPRP